MTTWRDKAACRNITTNPDFDPEEDPFYDPPEREDGGDKWEYARAMCAKCPVAASCLADAVAEEAGVEERREGFRGGHSPAQRHRIFLGLPAGPMRASPKKRRAIDLDEYMFLVEGGTHPVAAAHQMERTIHAVNQAARRAQRHDVTALTNAIDKAEKVRKANDRAAS